MARLKKIAGLIFVGFVFLMSNLTSYASEDDFSKIQKEKINQMIRAYILEHPEILPEAIHILQTRSKKTALEQNYTALYKDGFSHVGGNKNGDVTLIEFFDYNCPYCKQVTGIIEKLKKEDGNLRVIYKELPILAETSYIATKAAMAAREQDKYEIFHRALLQNKGKLTEDGIFEIARNIGLDEKILAKDMTSPVLDRNIKINHSLAQALGISGTPGFIIGDEIVSGAIPYEELVKLIKKARRQQAVKKTD